MDKPSEKKIATSAADIAMWLGRETGHAPGGAYESEIEPAGEEEDTKEGIGLPNMQHEGLRKFFDGLHMEKALSDKRKQNAVEDIDQAHEMTKALRGSIAPQGGGY